MSESVMPTYLLGFSEQEHQRLMVQSQLYDQITERAFVGAGIGPGMRVLDCGSGAGDVSLLAARLVGPTGSVLGVDQSPDSVARATARVDALGVTNVSFRMANLTALALEERFDAIVGRFIVLYLPERDRTMAQIVSHLVPGGVACFCEYDMSVSRTVPPTRLIHETMDRVIRAADGAGFDSQMGARLPGLLRRAGLEDVEAYGMTKLVDGVGSPVVDWIVDTVRNLAPLAARYGLVATEEWGLDTLRERLHGELAAANAIVEVPLVVGAHGRMPRSAS
jgi:ubiquinone/menaquinone biosynthesis C-methylase UbiE